MIDFNMYWAITATFMFGVAIGDWATRDERPPLSEVLLVAVFMLTSTISAPITLIAMADFWLKGNEFWVKGAGNDNSN